MKNEQAINDFTKAHKVYMDACKRFEKATNNRIQGRSIRVQIDSVKSLVGAGFKIDQRNCDTYPIETTIVINEITFASIHSLDK